LEVLKKDTNNNRKKLNHPKSEEKTVGGLEAVRSEYLLPRKNH
jgi:hypothetical protein